MFPTDAQTIRYANNTGTLMAGVSLLPTKTRTILQITSNSQNAIANSIVYCDADIIFRQRGNAVFINETMSRQCFSTVTTDIDKNSTILVTYVDYDMSLMSTTTQPVILNNGVAIKTGFSYGEVMIILVLLMIFTQLFFSALKEWIFGVRVENPMKNKYNKEI